MDMINNLTWTDLSDWGVIKSSLRIGLVVLIAALLLRFTRQVIKVFGAHVAQRNPENTRRVETLSGVFRRAAAVVIGIVAVTLILGELGISVTPILATAGVAGIAIGFGAQSLVRDFFTGFFLLIENQISEGDVIEAAGKEGFVEEVTLRHIRIRDYDGSVHFIPSGLITAVTNKSRQFAYAVIDVSVPRSKNIDKIFELMRQVGSEMRRDSRFQQKIIDDIEVPGVEKLDDSTVVIRCRIKVSPLKQWSVRREFLKRLKEALDRLDKDH